MLSLHTHSANVALLFKSILFGCFLFCILYGQLRKKAQTDSWWSLPRWQGIDKRFLLFFSPFTISSFQHVNLPHPPSSAWKSACYRKCFFGNTESIPVQSKLGKVLMQTIRIPLIEGALLKFKGRNISLPGLEV